MTDADDAYAHLRTDPDIGSLVERIGPLALDPAPDFFTRFVVSILRQQVSMASAAAIREQLFDALGAADDADGSDAAVLTPAVVLAADVATLRDAGLSRQKTRYVRNVAEAFRDREYSRSYFAGVDDDAVRAELTSITGVGTWTANVQLVFSLGRPDVFPVGDLGVRAAMRDRCGADLTREEMVDRAAAWRPYRSYASRYLWRDGD